MGEWSEMREIVLIFYGLTCFAVGYLIGRTK